MNIIQSSKGQKEIKRWRVIIVVIVYKQSIAEKFFLKTFITSHIWIVTDSLTVIRLR